MSESIPTLSAADVFRLIESEQVRFVNLQFTDIIGMVKSVTIPVERFQDAIEFGKWFDGSSIEGFARIAESDMVLLPDLSTFAIIPWERGENVAARVICHVYTPAGQPFEGDPRNALARVVAEAHALGFEYMTGPELEFFLFKLNGTEPLLHDQASYFDYSTDLAYSVRKEMVNALQGLGIRVESSSHEVAAGQHEIDFKYGPAIPTADNAVTLKVAMKAIADRHDLHATFMPKPIFGINGSGMHTHQSLADLKTGKNLFYDVRDPYNLSLLAKQFIAGQLAHARAMTAIVAPTVNSYKRLVPGYEAPVYISWARINRSALIRIPRFSAGQTQAARLELRCPDPSCNPYLAFAVMLAAGLDGIRRGLMPPEPVEEDLYHLDEPARRKRGVKTLPGSLAEALAELQKDEVIQAALGEHIYHRFLEAKTMEWEEYRIQVTPWELKRYLPVF